MKKIILSLIILSFLFGAEVSAQIAELVSPGILPDSPLYFIDALGEKIGLFFAFSSEKKAEKGLNYAEEKAAETRVMIERDKKEAMEKSAKKYQNYIELAFEKIKKAKEKGRDVELLVGSLMRKTNKCQKSLKETSKEKTGEIKEAVERVIEISNGVREETAKSFEEPEAKISILKTAPFVSREESRENICQNLQARKLKDRTQENIQKLCSEEFKEVSSDDKEKINETSEIFGDIYSQGEAGRYSQLLVNNLYTSLVPENVGLSYLPKHIQPLFTGYEKFKEEVEETVARVQANCPADGFNSWIFSVTCSMNTLQEGESPYSEEYFELGGPCPGEEAGCEEVVNVNSEIMAYMGSSKRREGDEEKIIRNLDVACMISCGSNNCPAYEDKEKDRKGCENPIYLSIYTSPEKNLQPTREDWEKSRGWTEEKTDKQIVLMCELRGWESVEESTSVEREDIQGRYKVQYSSSGVKTRNCQVVEGSCDYREVESPAGYLTGIARSCCCSCDLKPDCLPNIIKFGEKPKSVAFPDYLSKIKPCKCVDGTPNKQCSENKPMYCLNSILIPGCAECGCPEENQTCQNDGFCLVEICEDGTKYGECSTKQPFYCQEGKLIERCDICYCPEGTECNQKKGYCSAVCGDKKVVAFEECDPPGTFGGCEGMRSKICNSVCNWKIRCDKERCEAQCEGIWDYQCIDNHKLQTCKDCQWEDPQCDKETCKAECEAGETECDFTKTIRCDKNTCKWDNNPICVKGKCGADCASDADCSEGKTCDLAVCGCKDIPTTVVKPTCTEISEWVEGHTLSMPYLTVKVDNRTYRFSQFACTDEYNYYKVSWCDKVKSIPKEKIADEDYVISQFYEKPESCPPCDPGMVSAGCQKIKGESGAEHGSCVCVSAAQ